jgi:hypothetical protein
MSAIVKSVCVAAVLAFAPLIGAASAMSEDVAGNRAVEFKPLHGVSLHMGTKHAVGYFVADRGTCQLTLVVGDELDGDTPQTRVPARFRTVIEAGTHARLDTGEGKELQFTCAPGATAMSVAPLNQVAYTPVR